MSTTPNTPALSANLPAQVTLASGHVTGSYAKALARATVASPAGQDQPMSNGLGHACAELAALIPALIPALSRDSVPFALSAGRVVNPDVVHAMIILAAEIPAACAAVHHWTRMVKLALGPRTPASADPRRRTGAAAASGGGPSPRSSTQTPALVRRNI